MEKYDYALDVLIQEWNKISRQLKVVPEKTIKEYHLREKKADVEEAIKILKSSHNCVA